MAGFKACEGRALAWPFNVIREGLKDLMVGREVADSEVVGEDGCR